MMWTMTTQSVDLRYSEDGGLSRSWDSPASACQSWMAVRPEKRMEMSYGEWVFVDCNRVI